MVKLKGPGISQASSGQFAKVLTFAKTSSGHYVKKNTRPAQPNTPPQIGVKACIKFLSQQWKTLSTAQMDSWLDRSQTMDVANYHAYVSANASRFNNFKMPSKEDPATEAGAGSAMEHNYTQTHYRAISYHAKSGGPPINWSYILCRSQTSGFTPTPANAIAFFLKSASVYDVYFDRNLDPGTYYYRCSGFDFTGRLITFAPQLFNTVT